MTPFASALVTARPQHWCRSICWLLAAVFKRCNAFQEYSVCSVSGVQRQGATVQPMRHMLPNWLPHRVALAFGTAGPAAHTWAKLKRASAKANQALLNRTHRGSALERHGADQHQQQGCCEVPTGSLLLGHGVGGRGRGFEPAETLLV